MTLGAAFRAALFFKVPPDLIPLLERPRPWRDFFVTLRARSPQSDQLQGHQVTIEVTLSIDPAALGDDQTTEKVGDKLVHFGGPMVGWTPDMNGVPAKAKFKFKNQARCAKFVADALAIPGVSLATPQQRAERAP